MFTFFEIVEFFLIPVLPKYLFKIGLLVFLQFLEASTNNDMKASFRYCNWERITGVDKSQNFFVISLQSIKIVNKNYNFLLKLFSCDSKRL